MEIRFDVSIQKRYPFHVGAFRSLQRSWCNFKILRNFEMFLPHKLTCEF